MTPFQPCPKWALPKATKRCNVCGIEKPFNEFNVKRRGPKTYLRYSCKRCQCKYQSSKREGRRYKRYSLTDEQYNDLLNNQDNKCAICKQFLEIPHVDHDHNCCPSGVSCGQCVRGVLCKHCNIGISHFKDNPEYLQAAADYLKLMVASTISSTLIAQQCP